VILNDYSAGLGAFCARIVLIVGIFLQAFVEGMTYLRAADANEINSLDGLVDSFAIENAAFKLLDADTKELLVLTLDLTAASFILREVRVFIADFGRFSEPRVQITLGGFGLVRFRHGLQSLRHLKRPI